MEDDVQQWPHSWDTRVNKLRQYRGWNMPRTTTRDLDCRTMPAGVDIILWFVPWCKQDRWRLSFTQIYPTIVCCYSSVHPSIHDVMVPFCCLPSGLFFSFLTGSPFILVWIYCCGTLHMYVFYCHSWLHCTAVDAVLSVANFSCPAFDLQLVGG